MSTSKLQRVFSLLVMVALIFTVLQPQSADARGSANLVSSNAILNGQAQYAVRHDTSPLQLRSVPVSYATETRPDRESRTNFTVPKEVVDRSTITLDPVLQVSDNTNKKYIDPPMPSLDLGMNGANQGTNRTVNGYGVLPPDTNGDVSANHYIQSVNNVFTIWDLNRANPFTGLPLTVFGPARISDLFYGFGGPCEIWDDGDPVVVYDHLADRWLITQFALPNYPDGPFSECIAVSATGDPLGSWYRYEYQFASMNDYPKFGVWPDGYYMSINQFASGTLDWAGQGVAVFERDLMLTGGDARMIYIDTYATCTVSEPECFLGGMLPSDLDGPMPPDGQPNFFSQFDDDAWGYSPDQLQVWSFTTDWTAGTATFAHEADLPVAAFDSEVCASYARNCIGQPGTTQGVDAISDRLMYRLQYRNFGTYQTIVTNHTVDINDPAGHAGIRWYELRQVGGVWSVYQQGTFSPDASSRWMGSIAMDGSGNIALGYSVSDAVSVYPGIRYAGRLAGDPLGTLPQTEKVAIAGSGSQTHTAARWGDYSAMVVSPANDCEFWYTQQYNRVTSLAEWYTFIAAFTFPEPITPGDPGCAPHSAPTVVSSTRANSNPTSAASVDFTVTFSQSVTGVDVSDFSLTTTGVSGAAVSGVSGSGSVYTVTVATGTGNGTIRLDVVDDDTIVDAALYSLDGGFTSGEIYKVIKSATFADVPLDYWAWQYIERLYSAGITGGCTTVPLNYCPDSTVTRAEMAVLILKGIHGSSYTPPAVGASTGFTDVAIDYWAAAWIKQLAAEGITGGCGGTNYCPDATVTRAQLAVFLLKAEHGSSYSPPAATGVFTDVPVGYWAAAWIEQLAAEGITSGCGGTNYCPDADVTRAQMAVFLVKTFNLP